MIANTHYPYLNKYFTIESRYSGLTTLSTGLGYWDGILEYSTDLTTWTRMSFYGDISFRGKVYLRGRGNKYITGDSSQSTHPESYAWTINSHGADVYIHGDIDVLLDYQTYMYRTGSTYTPPTMGASAFQRMFKNWTTLKSAPSMNRTTLSYNCYDDMFMNCSQLQKAPDLPAPYTTGFCYAGMFEGCSSLKKPAVMAAQNTTEGCFGSMYASCTSLTEAPPLPATTLANNCYIHMFYGCSALTTVPQFTAQSVGSECCEGMFYGCSNIHVSTSSQGYPNYFFQFTGSLSTGSTKDMIAWTGGPVDTDPVANVTYYTSNPVV